VSCGQPRLPLCFSTAPPPPLHACAVTEAAVDRSIDAAVTTVVIFTETISNVNTNTTAAAAVTTCVVVVVGERVDFPLATTATAAAAVVVIVVVIVVVVFVVAAAVEPPFVRVDQVISDVVVVSEMACVSKKRVRPPYGMRHRSKASAANIRIAIIAVVVVVVAALYQLGCLRRRRRRRRLARRACVLRVIDDDIDVHIQAFKLVLSARGEREGEGERELITRT
jgi:hypothetical protein